jgi:hypothetical protein
MTCAHFALVLSEDALKRVAEIGGWDAYGARWAARLSNEGLN